MKKLISIVSLSAILAFVITSCERLSKEQRAADKLEGNWKVSNMVLNLDGKDSTYNTDTRMVRISFDKCYNAKGEKCNVRFNISPTYSIKDDIYIPAGYILEDNSKMKLFFMQDTLYFKIEDYKKDKLKLSGTDSTYGGANTNLIEADRQ